MRHVKIGGSLYGWTVLVAIGVGAYLLYKVYRGVAGVAEAAGEAIGTVKDGLVTIAKEPVQKEPSESPYGDLVSTPGP